MPQRRLVNGSERWARRVICAGGKRRAQDRTSRERKREKGRGVKGAGRGGEGGRERVDGRKLQGGFDETGVAHFCHSLRRFSCNVPPD